MDINAIVGQPDAPEENDRAVDTWRRIQEKPTSIIIVRGKTDPPLAAQTVRIEFSPTVRGAEMQGQGGGDSSHQYAIVYGVRNHPQIPDTDIQRLDRFVHHGVHYKVNDVLETIGEFQAHAEAQS